MEKSKNKRIQWIWDTTGTYCLNMSSVNHFQVYSFIGGARVMAYTEDTNFSVHEVMVDATVPSSQEALLKCKQWVKDITSVQEDE